jgi:hypothetical protein
MRLLSVENERNASRESHSQIRPPTPQQPSVRDAPNFACLDAIGEAAELTIELAEIFVDTAAQANQMRVRACAGLAQSRRAKRPRHGGPT